MKKEVTEEWIKEKAKDLYLYTAWEEGLYLEECEDFIRSLVEEIRGK